MQAEKLVNILIEKKLTISAMESCTGGLFTATLVSAPNASRVLNESIVAYSYESKIRNGVPKEIIDSSGMMSPATAIAMAKASKEKNSSSIGIGITGYLSNTEKEETSGLIYIGIAHVKTMTFQLHYPNLERTERQKRIVEFIINKLIEIL